MVLKIPTGTCRRWTSWLSYKCGQGFELGTRLAARAGLELGASELEVQHSNRSAMLQFIFRKFKKKRADSCDCLGKLCPHKGCQFSSHWAETVSQQHFKKQLTFSRYLGRDLPGFLPIQREIMESSLHRIKIFLSQTTLQDFFQTTCIPSPIYCRAVLSLWYKPLHFISHPKPLMKMYKPRVYNRSLGYYIRH